MGRNDGWGIDRMSMSNQRLTDISMVYYLCSGLALGGSPYNSIDVVRGFPEDPEKLTVPIVAVVSFATSPEAYQIGSKSEKRRNFIIEAYVSGRGYRDDMGDLLFNYLDEAIIPIKDYNQGFPPPKGVADEPSIIGSFTVDNINMSPVTYGNNNLLAKYVMRLNIGGIVII